MTVVRAIYAAIIRDAAERGISYRETADQMGVKYHTVVNAARRYGIKFKLEKRGRKQRGIINKARAKQMVELYRDGQTLAQIGETFGITRERVRQIMTSHAGIRAKDGGKVFTAAKARAARKAAKDRKSLAKWGCTYAEYLKILKHPDKPTYAFWSQVKNAQKREIPFELSLADWWRIWQTSGHWDQRGRGANGYQMCRLNDTGPYAVDNVYIATCTENMKDYWARVRQEDARQ